MGRPVCDDRIDALSTFVEELAFPIETLFLFTVPMPVSCRAARRLERRARLAEPLQETPQPSSPTGAPELPSPFSFIWLRDLLRNRSPGPRRGTEA